MKKLLSILLAVCMIAGVFTACGNAAAEKSNAAQISQETSVSEKETAEEVPDAADEMPAAAQVSVAESANEATEESVSEPVHTPIEMPLTEEPVTLSFFMNFNPQAQDYAQDMSQNLFYQTLEELSGVSIDFVLCHPAQYETIFNLHMASGDYLDIYSEDYCGYSGGFDAAVEDGVYLELTPYLEEYAPNYYSIIHSSEGNLRDAMTDSGRVVSFNLYYPDGQICQEGPMIRADWAEAFGMDPTEINTYAEYEDYIEQAYKTYGATVQVQSNGAPNYGYLTAGYGTMSVGSRATIEFLNIDGEATCSLQTDGFKEYIKMMAKWYKNGWLYSDFISLTDLRGSGGADFGMVTSGESSLWWAERDYITQYEAEGIDVAAIQDAVQNEGDITHISQVDPGNVANMTNLVITTSCKYPEIAISWIDYRYSEEGSLLANWGVENVTFTYDQNGDKVYTDLIADNPSGMPSSIAKFVYLLQNAPAMSDETTKDQGLNAEQLEASVVWQTNKDNAYNYPDTITLTTEEQEAYNSKLSDIQTYAAENVTKFITGEQPLSELDDFITTVEDMGLNECVEIQQAGLERYYSR